MLLYFYMQAGETLLEDEPITPEEFDAELRAGGNLWTHDGNPERPHPVFVSEEHHRGFANIRRAGKKTGKGKRLIRRVGASLVEIARREIPSEDLERVTSVSSTGYASVPWGYEVSRRLDVDFVFTDKKPTLVDGKIVENMEFRFDLDHDEVVLCVDEMHSTLGSMARGNAAIQAKHPDVEFLPFALCAFSWTLDASRKLPGWRVLPLLHKQDVGLTAEECKERGLCSQGSEALRNPKHAANWTRLIADYDPPTPVA